MEWMQLLGGGGLVALLSILGTVYIGRGTNKNRNKEVEAERAKAALAGNIELTKYVREQVAEAVTSATKGLREEIDSLRAELRLVIQRERDTKAIIRRWFQRIVWWNERGRIGDMPMPSADDMQRLDLHDIEITSPPEDVAALRKPYVPPIPERKETE